MIPVDQTELVEIDQTGKAVGGNCLTACLASLLDKPIGQVPRMVIWDSRWQLEFRLVCLGLGVDPVMLFPSPELPCAPRGWSIMSGQSPRGDFLHATVAWNGRIVHDPHPSRAGLLTVSDFIVLRPAGGWSYDISLGPLPADALEIGPVPEPLVVHS